MFDTNYVIHIHDGDLSSIKTDWIQRLFFKRAKRIAGVSISIVNEYKNKFDVDVMFLPPVIPMRNLEISKEELKKKFKLDKYDQIILFLGTLKPLKAPDVLLRAITMMDKNKLEENRVGFVIVGGGPMEIELRSSCSANDLDNFVHFTGRVPYEDTANYFSMADIFVIPSWHEGTSISLLEAMYNGLACVGSKVPGITDVLEDGKNSILFQKNNSEELSNVLDQLVQDSNKQKSLGEAARRDVIQRYDYRDHLSEMMHFLLDE
ncbi:MAG: glycosyltransferase family 4 protein [Bacteroidales bacterium]|nr:glycosyltransferase family 4 protein [Bacteroidales bacterium]